MKKSTTLIMLLLILLQSTGWSDIYLAKKNGERYDRKFRLTTEGIVTEGDVTESIPALQSGSLVLSRSNGSTYEHLAEFTAGDQIHLTGKVKENQNPFSQSNLLGFTYRVVEQGQVVYKPRALFSYHSGTKNYSDLELKGLYNALQLRRVTSYIGSAVFETACTCICVTVKKTTVWRGIQFHEPLQFGWFVFDTLYFHSATQPPRHQCHQPLPEYD